MDNRTRAHLLLSVAYSAVQRIIQWLSNNIAMELSHKQPQEKASWTREEEITFLDYLVKHRSKSAHGGFTNTVIHEAIVSIAPLHKQGAVKNKSHSMNKWSTVSQVLSSVLIHILTIHQQWKQAYNAIRDYWVNASSGHWDNLHGANINDNDPAAVEFWKGYTKSNVHFLFLILL